MYWTQRTGIWIPPTSNRSAPLLNNTGNDKFARTTALPSVTSFTICGWVMWTVSVVTGTKTPMELNGGNTNNYAYIQTDGGGTPNGQLRVQKKVAGVDGGYTAIGTLIPTLNVWYYIAMVGSGAALTGYAITPAGVIHTGVSSTAGGFTSSQMQFGNSIFTDEILQGRLAAYKVYDVALNLNEILWERSQYVPVRQIGINSWFPMNIPRDGMVILDAGSYRRNLTLGATITYAAGPPIFWQNSIPTFRHWMKRPVATNTYPGYYSNMGGWF